MSLFKLPRLAWGESSASLLRYKVETVSGEVGVASWLTHTWWPYGDFIGILVVVDLLMVWRGRAGAGRSRAGAKACLEVR